MQVLGLESNSEGVMGDECRESIEEVPVIERRELESERLV